MKTPLFVVIMFSAFMFGCSDSNSDLHNHPKNITSKQLFENHCAICHHSAGNGNFLEGIPANRDTKKSAHEIVNFLRAHRKPESGMPSFENMPTEEAYKLAIYLLELKTQTQMGHE